MQEEQIRAGLRVPFYLAPATMNRQRAGAVASLGAELYAQGRFLKGEEFAPEYLRPSQAERVREEMRQKNGYTRLPGRASRFGDCISGTNSV